MPMLQTLILDNSIFQSEALQELRGVLRARASTSAGGCASWSAKRPADIVDLFETNLRHLEACGVKVDASIQYASEDPLPHNWCSRGRHRPSGGRPSMRRTECHRVEK
jgi:hypothetical protein